MEKLNANLIDSANLTEGGFTIHYQKGGFPNPLPGNVQKPKSPFYDELRFGPYNNVTIDSDTRLKLVSIVTKVMIPISPGRGVGPSEEQVQVEAIHSSTLERLEHLNEELISTTHAYRNKLDEEFSSKVSELEAQTKVEKEKLNGDYETRTVKLEVQEKTLADKLKVIDDRDNTHVRLFNI